PYLKYNLIFTKLLENKDALEIALQKPGLSENEQKIGSVVETAIYFLRDKTLRNEDEALKFVRSSSNESAADLSSLFQKVLPEEFAKTTIKEGFGLFLKTPIKDTSGLNNGEQRLLRHLESAAFLVNDQMTRLSTDKALMQATETDSQKDLAKLMVKFYPQLETTNAPGAPAPAIDAPLTFLGRLSSSITSFFTPVASATFPCYDEILSTIKKRVAIDSLDQEAALELLMEQAFHEIIPNLYLGGSYTPEKIVNYQGKKSREMTFDYVVHATIHNRDLQLVPNPSRQEFTFKVLNKDIGLDSFEYNDQKDLNECISNIHEYLKKGQKVFVHCQQGKDRSALIIMAYLMSVYPQMNAQIAQEFVSSKRQIVGDMEMYITFLQDRFKRVPLE
ncbi:MAG: dual specificity protein phosphatase, partial [Parachlamydiaceae bacterium]